jgi:hypothetical protein
VSSLVAPDAPDVKTLSDSTVITASGTEQAVCRQALATQPSYSPGPVTIIAHATFGSTRWLICMSAPAVGPGIVSARTPDGVHWTVLLLCAATPFHAGDAVDAHIDDARRAWITDDVLVGPFHTHGWTVDAGKTWTCVTSY